MSSRNKSYYFFIIVFSFNFIFAFSSKCQIWDKSDYIGEKINLRIVGGYYTSFKSNWASLDIEFSGIKPLSKLKMRDEHGKWKNRTLFSTNGFSVMQLGGEYNFENHNFGIRLGLMQWISLLSINPVQFIYNTNALYKGFTYRPELGLGFWIFQLNYGYNVNFNKAATVMGKHLLIFKIHLPF